MEIRGAPELVERIRSAPRRDDAAASAAVAVILLVVGVLVERATRSRGGAAGGK